MSPVRTGAIHATATHNAAGRQDPSTQDPDTRWQAAGHAGSGNCTRTPASWHTLGPVIQDLLVKAQEIIGDMSTVEWIIAIGLAITLGAAVVQQLAKTALIIVALIAVGLVLMNGRVEHWTF